jgi:Zn-dependent protease
MIWGRWQLLVLGLPAFLLGIILHEVAHGWVAYRLGDPTAKMMGRLTLNPRAHFDPIGALMFLFIGFGWAKPVPINPSNFRDRRAGMAISAIAGPLANLAQLIAWSALFHAYRLLALGPSIILDVLVYGVWINAILMIFNLIPIPPLDGSRILAWMLPDREAYLLDRLEPFGFLILLIAFYVLHLFYLIAPAVEAVVRVFLTPL